MDIKDILKRVDHTLLSPAANIEQIKILCDEGIDYGTASVCIPPCFVKEVKAYVGDRLRLCTVIGFPNGYNKTEVKCFEARQAVDDGADELDTVINIGMLKAGMYDALLDEIRTLKAVCGDRVLKVIIETCMLTEEEKIIMCDIVTRAGADFIKTSTGFGSKGAVFEDIVLFKKYIGDNVRIKAAGGISTVSDAEKFIELGADRLGTSRIVRLAKEAGL